MRHAPLAAAAAPAFANGADVSWVDQQEAAGQVFRDSNGIAANPFVLLKNLQMDSIRLRVWVNPVDGWNNGADVLYKAQRVQAQGQRILIDFHYSDSWADPGQQTKPAACELGMDWQQATTANSMMANLIAKTKALGNQGLGVFYWEPQASPGWQGYTMGALDASGKFTIALDPY